MSDIRDLVQQWAKAERLADADLLDGLLAADFVAVGPRGFVLNKEQWLNRYRSGALEHTSFDVQDPQVHDHGAAVVVVATQLQQTSYQGRDSSGQFRITLVLVRQPDRWLIASTHLSPIAGPVS